MKTKLSVLIALIACLVVGSVTAAQAAKVKVKSTITLQFNNNNPTGSTSPYYDEDTFSGKVKAKKNCQKNRVVKLNGTGLQTTTNSSGDYVIGVGNAAPGTYTTTVKKKVIQKKHKKKICKKATSDPVTVTS